MRFINPAFPFKRLERLLTSISVRSRIVALALIPVVGFLANGLTYLSGEREVGTAFETVKHSTALADASRDFKGAVAAMQITGAQLRARACAGAAELGYHRGLDRPPPCRKH